MPSLLLHPPRLLTAPGEKARSSAECLRSPPWPCLPALPSSPAPLLSRRPHLFPELTAPPASRPPHVLLPPAAILLSANSYLPCILMPPPPESPPSFPRACRAQLLASQHSVRGGTTVHAGFPVPGKETGAEQTVSVHRCEMAGRGRRLSPPRLAQADSPMTSSCTCMKLSASSWRVLCARSGTGRKPYTSLLQTYIWISGAKETTIKIENRAVRQWRQPPNRA